MGGESKVVVKEGGDVRIPARGSMTVPLDPGVGGLREVLLGHGQLERNNLITADITIRHMGRGQGFTAIFTDSSIPRNLRNLSYMEIILRANPAIPQRPRYTRVPGKGFLCFYHYFSVIRDG